MKRILILKSALASQIIDKPGKFFAIHSQPNGTSSVITKVPSGQEVEYLNEKKEWQGFMFHKIKWKTFVGWITEKWLVLDEPAQNQKPVEKPISEKTMPQTGSQADWLRQISPAVAACAKKYGLPEACIFAQAALESGWGKHDIGGFNYFGLKGVGPAGSTSTKTKEEFKPGEISEIKSSFQKFNSPDEGFDGYGKFISSNGRYAKAIQNYSKCPSKYIIYIWGVGYATSSSYPETIASVSSSVAQKLGRPELKIDFDDQEKNIISQLKVLAPKERKAKVETLL